MTERVVVGLMSGTSLDGISAAVARFRTNDAGARSVELLSFVSRPYTTSQRARLADVMVGTNPAEVTRLDFALGGWLADAAVQAIAECGVPRAAIAAVASHGHTVWHEPPHATWQFGQAAVIAERVGLPVISDFRVRDVAAGGQGAPLVPIADAVLFGAPTHWRALQNLGGIGNITIVPPGPHPELAAVRAFDTGPGVCVIDAVVRALVPGMLFDTDGELARAGTPLEEIVREFLDLPFFGAEPPKSTGRELFTPDFIDAFIARCLHARPECSVPDIVATATTFTAQSIALSVARFIPEPVAEIVLSGGGARNPALVAAIERALATVPAAPGFLTRRVVPFDDLFFDGEAKEAVAFALLGALHLDGVAGNVPSATGARGARILGTYTPA